MATTLTPFLYQTRTILRASVALRAFSTTASRLHRGREQPIPFEWEGAVEERADIPSGADGEVKSTITPTERHVFRKIFDELASRGVPPSQNPPKPAAPGGGSRDAILDQYPPSLRRAAAAAFEMRETPEGYVHWQENPFTYDPETDGEALSEARAQSQAREELRAEESARLQLLLDECYTDVQVWNVLEREVFSMVAKLGIAKESKNKTEKVAAAGKQQPTLDMDSYGPVYSMHLLQGLTVLDKNFAQSSPLALNVLPRIKELGLASFVLGVSTPFYNELAAILWYRYGDTEAVVAVLEEMQRVGLLYNKQTLRLVNTIQQTLDSFRGRRLGVFSKAVATIPGYNLDARTKFTHHARRVRHFAKASKGDENE